MKGARNARAAGLTLLFPVLAGTAMIVGACQGAGSLRGKADLILENGNIVTVDPERPDAEAVAIRGDRILAVGTNADIEAYAATHTKTIDLNGATALPGLIDSHMHFPQLGKRTKTLFLDETSSPEEAVRIVQEQVKKAEPGEWITGQGWHTVYWNQTEYPDKSELNRIAPDNPVFLLGMAIHAAWVNDRVLELAGITKDTPNPEGGQILKDPITGEPTGILLEDAIDIVRRVQPPETRETKKADIELSIQTALRLGLTSVHDASVGYEEIAIYEELLEADELDIRLYEMFYVPDAGELLDSYIESPPRIGLGDNRLTIRSVKAFADGALGARGAALLEPYSDSPEDRGLIPNSEEEIYEIVRKSMETGYQPVIHAIGDRSNRVTLDAIERAQRELGIDDARARIEHAQILSPQDIPRFAQLGAIASMQPVHCTMDMGFAEKRVGPERMRGAYAWRTLLESGAKVAAGSDTPSFPVHYTNPLWGIHAAVTRQDNDGQPPGGWYPEEKVSRMQAIRMYTIDAAYAAFEEDLKGTLTPGKLADVTVLSRDIMSIPASEILETEVLMTIVGGEVVFRR